MPTPILLLAPIFATGVPGISGFFGPPRCHYELSCSGGAPPTEENGFPSVHGSTDSPRAVGIPFVLRLSKGERAIVIASGANKSLFTFMRLPRAYGPRNDI